MKEILSWTGGKALDLRTGTPTPIGRLDEGRGRGDSTEAKGGGRSLKTRKGEKKR